MFGFGSEEVTKLEVENIDKTFSGKSIGIKHPPPSFLSNSPVLMADRNKT